MPTLDDLAVSLTSTEAITIGTEAQTHLTAAVSLTAGGPGSGRYPKGSGKKSRAFRQNEFEGLPNDTDQAIAAVASKVAERWDVTPEGLKALSREERFDFESSEQALRFYLKQWAGGGGGPVAEAAIQHVYERLGGQVEGRPAIKYIRNDTDLDQATRSLGDAMYGLTQEHFAESGTTHIRLYRSGGEGNGIYTSWSGGYGGTRKEAYPDMKVREEDVPVKQVFSTFGTGFGTHAESEAVVMAAPKSLTAGGPGSGRYPRGSGKNPQASWRNPRVQPSLGAKYVKDGTLFIEDAEDYWKARFSDLKTAEEIKAQAATRVAEKMRDIPVEDFIEAERDMRVNPMNDSVEQFIRAREAGTSIAMDHAGWIVPSSIEGAVKANSPEGEQLLREHVASVLIMRWGITAADNDPSAWAIQLAAKDVFSVERLGREGTSAVGTDELLAKHGDLLRGFVKGQAVATQKQLIADGIREIEVSRGIVLSVDRGARSGVQPIDLRPMSSFTTSPAVATFFAEAVWEGQVSAVLTAKVPVENILAMPGTGAGNLGEREVIVKGPSITADVVVKDYEGNPILASGAKLSRLAPDERGGEDWIKTLSWDLPTDPRHFSPEELERLSKLPAWAAAPESIKAYYELTHLSASVEVTDTNSPGKALSERAQLEAQLRAEVQSAFAQYLVEVKDDALRQPTTALTAGLTLTLGTVLRRWTAFVKKVAGKFGAIFGVGDDYVDTLITRLAEGATPGKTLETVQEVLRAAGDSADIEKRLTDALSENLEQWAAERVVRTEATSAYNAYRLDRLTTPYKRWVAHHDERTREAHAAADGQVVKVDSPFKVGNDLMQYPGDHQGSASNVVNCRCVLVGTDDPPEHLLEDLALGLGAVVIEQSVARVATSITATEGTAAGGAATLTAGANLTPSEAELDSIEASGGTLSGMSMIGKTATFTVEQLTSFDTCEPCNLTAGADAEALEDVPAPAPKGRRWFGVIGVEGEMTGDGRYIELNALSWSDPATTTIPLRYVSSDVGAHSGAQVVGRITSIERREDGTIFAEGIFDNSEIGQEAQRQVAEGMTTGVSMDLDQVSFEVRVSSEMVNEAVAQAAALNGEAEALALPAEDGDGRVTISKKQADSEVNVTTAGRVRAATIVAIPAFDTARIALADDGDNDASEEFGWNPLQPRAANGRWGDGSDADKSSGSSGGGATPIEGVGKGYDGEFTSTMNPKQRKEYERGLAEKKPFTERDKKLLGKLPPEKQAYLLGRYDASRGGRVNGLSEEERKGYEYGRKRAAQGKGPKKVPSPQETGVEAELNDEERGYWLGLYDGMKSKDKPKSLEASVNDDDDFSLTAAGIPVNPPALWFSDPRLDKPTPLTVTKEGRVYGHLAQWGTCHVSHSHSGCVTAPKSNTNYAFFRMGAVLTEEGSEVSVGHITLDTRHAGGTLGPAQAAAHYDNTGSVVADVAAGEDSHGIWVAGALRPTVTDEQIRALRSAPLSGDWRRVNGNLELVAALAVNVPGFPIPRPAGLVASGAVQSLVASGIIAPKQVIPPDNPKSFLSADDIRYLKQLAAREQQDEMARLAGQGESLASRVRATALAMRVQAARPTEFGYKAGQPRDARRRWKDEGKGGSPGGSGRGSGSSSISELKSAKTTAEVVTISRSIDKKSLDEQGLREGAKTVMKVSSGNFGPPPSAQEEIDSYGRELIKRKGSTPKGDIVVQVDDDGKFYQVWGTPGGDEIGVYEGDSGWKMKGSAYGERWNNDHDSYDLAMQDAINTAGLPS